jgi:DNA polymerase III delta prime subunit
MQDYSAHKINAHKHLKEMHLLLLKNNFDEAMKQADEAIVQLRMAKASIADLKEKYTRDDDGSR